MTRAWLRANASCQAVVPPVTKAGPTASRIRSTASTGSTQQLIARGPVSVCQQKRSGNTRREALIAASTLGGKPRRTTSFVGERHPMVQPARSAAFLVAIRRLDCPICREMCTSGRQASMTTTPASVGVAAGAATPRRTSVPRLASGTPRRFATSTSVFAVPGEFPSILFTLSLYQIRV